MSALLKIQFLRESEGLLLYTDDREGVVEILSIREKSEAIEWLAEFDRREE